MGKDKNEALDIISQYQPISIYQLHKKLKVAYSTAWNLVKDLEKENKIVTYFKKMRANKLIKIKEEESER